MVEVRLRPYTSPAASSRRASRPWQQPTQAQHAASVLIALRPRVTYLNLVYYGAGGCWMLLCKPFACRAHVPSMTFCPGDSGAPAVCEQAACMLCPCCLPSHTEACVLLVDNQCTFSQDLSLYAQHGLQVRCAGPGPSCGSFPSA